MLISFFENHGKMLLFPIMLLNITVSQNQWHLFGVHLGQVLYWTMIFLSWFIVSKSSYSKASHLVLMAALLFKGIEFFDPSGRAILLRTTFLAINFMLAGIVIYGRNIKLLNQQFIVFFGLCIPIMLVQILGVHSFFMGWNTELSAAGDVLAGADVGKFSNIPVYKTFLVSFEDLHFSVAQGRPVGLLDSNNVLSVFISIAIVTNSLIRKNNFLTISDFIVSFVAVLSMSKLVLGVSFLTFFISILIQIPQRRFAAVQNFCLILFLSFLYFVFFPGLFIANLSPSMLWLSFLVRFVDIVESMGINAKDFFHEQQFSIKPVYQSGESYSAISLILKNPFFIPIFVIILFIGVVYVYRTFQIKDETKFYYVSILVVMVLTQFAVPFFIAPSFQLIFGITLIPLFLKTHKKVLNK